MSSNTGYELSGLSDKKIDYSTLNAGVHEQLVAPFLVLNARANKVGFNLSLVSGFRDFNRQLAIWNAKAEGGRPVLGANSQPVNIEELSPWQLCQAILRWSALPGASRHHWGTDIDVYDSAAVNENYVVQLVDAEVMSGGPFAPLHNWLDQQIDSGNAEGFFRPYQIDRGGIAPERWHLSYAPLAAEFQRQFNLDDLVTLIKQQPLALKDTVLENIEEIFQRFIEVPNELYPAEYRSSLVRL